MRKLFIALVILGIVGATILFYFVPMQVEKRMNVVLHPPPYAASQTARDLHSRILVADLHADSLLWDRNLIERGTRGHVDVPRLIEGNVALQAFTIVSKTPRNQNIEANDDSTDNITLLAIAERWPLATWRSLTARALYQAQRLSGFAADSKGKLTLIRSAQELDQYLERRKSEPGITAGFLGIEGAQALDGSVDNVDLLFEAGVRMMAPTHFFDNDLGGSAHGITKGGLTEKGKEMIRRMEAKKMIVDIAHASAQTIEDVLAMATRPIIVSHTGVKGTCDNNRNLSDDQLRAIAKNGGLVGVGFWGTAVCGTDAKAIARAIKHAVTVTTINHVALGSDFDGAVTEPFDVTGMVQITDALLAEGFTDSDIEKIMGGNVIRFLRENLPEQ